MDDHATIFGSMNNLEFVFIDETSPLDGGWLESSNMSFDFSSSSYFDINDIHMVKSVDDRLIQAVEFLNKRCIMDKDVLVQIWLPVTRQGKLVLTVEDQPFVINSDSVDLSNYREVSKNYKFGAELIGLPSTVYLKMFPSCIPDLQFVGEENDPRVIYAQKLNLYGCLNLPVFELDGETCVRVIEVVTTSQKVNFRDQIENICKALEAVDLRSSEFLVHPKLKADIDFSEPYQLAVAEIRDVLRSICNTLKLPLAQTWGPCKSSSKNLDTSIYIIESASYVFDPHVLGFFEACCALQLVPGEGIAGKALGTNQPCFADINDFCRDDYPAAHEARMFGLEGAVAIRLHSTYTGPLDFVLEFFLPRDCKSHVEHQEMRSSIASMIKNLSWSLHETQDEVVEEILEPASFSVNETNTHDESWISHMLEAQRRGENVVLSMGCQKEEPEEEFKVINHQFYHGLTFSDHEKQTYLGWGSNSKDQSLGTKRSTEKGRAKTERNISLQVLQQYFPGSLKDAAKNIGVCPTTLKRICRQHGIMRWPSRKIKKVSHSLKKLQLVIDSVQGADGMINLGSFYTNFPELSSPVPPSPKPKVNDQINHLKSQTTPSHSSSSCSGGSSDPTGTEKMVLETKLPVACNNDKLKTISQGECVFRVKASYGDEKIRFKMSKDWGFGDLQQEISRRFNKYSMEDIILEYMDDDNEWVLLACDADLEECMDLHTSTKNQTIKLLIHRSSHASFVPLVHQNDGINMW
ncbi:hypothetical protein QVD17_28542 [Tagetes erecta]|uniref:Uncharacterized protein n=1 Tax=Tagetes erecta TaxID=13708 RepID=A0AAD8KDJ6_TARER|nr:hypothetical protein QVD17_28542 [Tagetes erecta]